MKTHTPYTVSLALLLLLLQGCGEATDNKANLMNKQLTYLALGDSYTIGEGVDVPGRWPVQLAGKLAGEGYPFAPPQIVARTGWTTDELMDGIEKASPAGPFNLVSLLIGVNNQYRGRDTANFRVEFTQLLEQALGFAANDADRVLVLSIPDWGVTPFAEGRDRQKIAAEIDAYNLVVKNVSELYDVLFVDVTGISRMAADDSSLLATDGLHPSEKMYAMWVDKAMAPVVERIKIQQQ